MNKIFPLLAAILLLTGLYSCADDSYDPFAGTDNYIVSFVLSVDGADLTTVLRGDSVIVYAPASLSLAGATARVTLSENASIFPSPEEVDDWGRDLQFRVTSRNGQTRDFFYTTGRTETLTSGGSVFLSTPAEMEAFAASGITFVDGSLIVGSASGTDPIRSLHPLSALEGVKHKLLINSTVAAEDLIGLENLETVGSLHIASSASPRHLRLPSLREVTGGFSVPTLENFVCPALERVGGDLSLTIEFTEHFDLDVHRLRMVDGIFTVDISPITPGKDFTLYLPLLESVGGTFSLSGSGLKPVVPKLAVCGGVTVTASEAPASLYFPALRETGAVSLSSASLAAVEMPLLEKCASMTLSGRNLAYLDFSSLNTVSGSFTLMAVPVPNLDAFPALETVGGTILMRGLDVTDLGGLSSLRTVGRELNLYDVPVTDFSGLESLEAVGGLVLYLLTSLEGIDGIGRLENIPSLEMSGLAAGIDIDLSGADIGTVTGYDLGEVTLRTGPSVGGQVFLSDCRDMELPDLVHAGSVNLSGDGRVSMPRLETVERTLSVQLRTDSFTPLASFPCLAEIGGNATITAQNRVRLADGEGIVIPSLRTIGGNLTIGGTVSYYGFTDLDFLSSLVSVGAVTVSNQSNLSSFAGLKNALASFTTLTCRNNLYNPTYDDLVQGRWTVDD